MRFPWITRSLIAVLVLTLAGAPELIAQTAQTQQQDQQQQPKSQQNPTVMPDPSKGPLQPVPSDQDIPNAPSASQPAQPQTQTLAPAQQTAPQAAPQRPEEPLGAAAAEGAKVNGGLASKPAGNAIAPAKQRQVRSLLIKLGAIAAGGAALGIVYGLSRSTSSVPPHASASTSPTH